MLALGLIVFLIGINVLNVISSYVGRDFMTAIANREMDNFVRWAVFYVLVFGMSTIVAVVNRFCEERLGLLWREWLTRQALIHYLQHPVYYRLGEAGTVANPDQRIADDIKAFTVTTLSFVLMLLNGSFTIVAFAGVMWTISPLLFCVAVVYAGLGSFLTIYLGRPLVWLNYSQLDKEANFRADLLHIRENAEPIAVLRREPRISQRINRHFDELVSNFRRIIAVNRNLGFFTTGYNYLIQIIPALIVAPMYIRGQVEFGVITQAGIAFVQLLGAFSLIVTQFQSISSFAAVLSRLDSLWDGIEKSQSAVSPIAQEVGPDGIIEFQGVSLRMPDGELLLNDLSYRMAPGDRVYVTGCNARAKHALFRAAAGIWDSGAGKIVRPGLDAFLLVPERPYLPPGTLREAMLRTTQTGALGDEALWGVLETLGVAKAVVQAGGLDVERHWEDVLSLGELQLIVFARALLASIRFVFFDRPGTALSTAQVGAVLRLLEERGVAYLVIGDDEEPERPGFYDTVLEFGDQCRWLQRAAATAASYQRRASDRADGQTDSSSPS
jgi:putative ATP-binding cassette transporter